MIRCRYRFYAESIIPNISPPKDLEKHLAICFFKAEEHESPYLISQVYYSMYYNRNILVILRNNASLPHLIECRFDKYPVSQYNSSKFEFYLKCQDQ